MKTTKKQLTEKMEYLQWSFTQSYNCVDVNEWTQARDRIKRVGLELIQALETDLNKAALDLKPRAERMVDSSTRHIEKLNGLIINRG